MASATSQLGSKRAQGIVGERGHGSGWCDDAASRKGDGGSGNGGIESESFLFEIIEKQRGGFRMCLHRWIKFSLLYVLNFF